MTSASWTTLGLLFLGTATTGCATALWAQQRSIGVHAPASVLLPIGSSRQQVETTLGKPATSRALPDGGRVDTYTYSVRPSRDWPGNMTGGAWALFDIIFFGIPEIMFLPEAVQEASGNRRTATITYDQHDLLLYHGLPPAYGPPEDSVGTLSLSQIKERCRSDGSNEAPGLPGRATSEVVPPPDALYDQCLVRRLAIWGVE